MFRENHIPIRVIPYQIYEMRINNENTARPFHQTVLQMPFMPQIQKTLWRKTHQRYGLPKLVRVYA
jgi:hypothetical protein